MLCVSNCNFGLYIARAIWILLALQMAKIVVNVVDGDGNSIRPKPVTFKPPKTCEGIVKALQAAGCGEGLLEDMDGDAMTPGDSVPAGDYKYCVAGECTMQQGQSIPHMPPMLSA